jgi:hypothetical protein
MIRVAGQHGDRAVDLLGEQHAHEAVRQRERGQGDLRERALLDALVETVGAADHERDSLVGIAPVSKLGRERARGPGGAAFVQRDDAKTGARGVDARGFGRQQLRDPASTVARGRV